MTDFLVFLLVSVVGAIGTAGQTPPPGTRAREIFEERRRPNEVLTLINAEEPGWTWHPAFKTGFPAIGSDREIVAGIFEYGGSPKQPPALQTSVWVDVQQLSSVSAAKRFIARGRTRAPAAGWTRKSYDLADESSLSEHVSGQHELSFRLGTFVGTVGGRELPRVERIAGIIVAYLAKLD